MDDSLCIYTCKFFLTESNLKTHYIENYKNGWKNIYIFFNNYNLKSLKNNGLEKNHYFLNYLLF